MKKMFYGSALVATVFILFFVYTYFEAKSNCMKFLESCNLKPDLTFNSISFSREYYSREYTVVFKFNTLHKKFPVIPWDVRNWRVDSKYQYNVIWRVEKK